MQIRKFPRTHHLRGSRLQPGDEGHRVVSTDEIAGQQIVIEEKVDGANAGLSFDSKGKLLLQSRGHYLTGGPRERHWDLFKQWGHCHQADLRARLGDRYLMFGEWLYAKHTVFYDALPHYFLEFDIFDREAQVFLSTPRRRELLAGSAVVSVNVLWEGVADRRLDLEALVARTGFKSPRWQEALVALCEARRLDPGRAQRQTDPSSEMEGLYIKVEGRGTVEDRFKFVRESFSQAIHDDEGHWLDRPIIPNQLSEGVDIFGGVP